MAKTKKTPVNSIGEKKLIQVGGLNGTPQKKKATTKKVAPKKVVKKATTKKAAPKKAVKKVAPKKAKKSSKR